MVYIVSYCSVQKWWVSDKNNYKYLPKLNPVHSTTHLVSVPKLHVSRAVFCCVLVARSAVGDEAKRPRKAKANLRR